MDLSEETHVSGGEKGEMKRPQEDGADFAEEKREADGQNDKTDSNEVTEDNTKFTANDESEGDESDSDFYDGFIDQEELDMYSRDAWAEAEVLMNAQLGQFTAVPSQRLNSSAEQRGNVPVLAATGSQHANEGDDLPTSPASRARLVAQRIELYYESRFRELRRELNLDDEITSLEREQQPLDMQAEDTPAKDKRPIPGTSLSDWAERREGNTKEGNTSFRMKRKRRCRNTPESNINLRKKRKRRQRNAEGNTRLIKRQKRRDRSTTDSNAALKKKAQEEDGDDTDSSFFDDMDTEDEAEDLFSPVQDTAEHWGSGHNQSSSLKTLSRNAGSSCRAPAAHGTGTETAAGSQAAAGSQVIAGSQYSDEHQTSPASLRSDTPTRRQPVTTANWHLILRLLSLVLNRSHEHGQHPNLQDEIIGAEGRQHTNSQNARRSYRHEQDSHMLDEAERFDARLPQLHHTDGPLLDPVVDNEYESHLNREDFSDFYATLSRHHQHDSTILGSIVEHHSSSQSSISGQTELPDALLVQEASPGTTVPPSQLHGDSFQQVQPMLDSPSRYHRPRNVLLSSTLGDHQPNGNARSTPSPRRAASDPGQSGSDEFEDYQPNGHAQSTPSPRRAELTPGRSGDDDRHWSLEDFLGKYRRWTSMTSEELQSLRTHRVTEEEVSQPAAAAECRICLESYKAGDIQRELPCLHTFHKSCIDKWLKRHVTCPLCRMRTKHGSKFKVSYPMDV